MKIDNENKYGIVQNLDAKGHDTTRYIYATRYGEQWRDLVGDSLVLAMYYRIEYLTKLLDENSIKHN